jgi:radical SAM superfamily enzyme YgiQ (UPF0313 family)
MDQSPLGIYSLTAYLKERHIPVQNYFVTLPLTKECTENFSMKIWNTPSLFSDFLVNPEKCKSNKVLYSDFLRIKQHMELWVDLFERKKSSAIGILTYYNNLFLSLLFAKQVKKRFPEIKIILGGPEIRESNKKIFLQERFADVVIPGEGEEVLYQILLRIKNNSLSYCKGATVRKGNKIIDGGTITTPLDMNSLPAPDFDGLTHGENSIHVFPVAFNRGCVFRCEFCYETLFWKDFRQMDVARAIEILSALKNKYGALNYLFSQSLMNGDIKWLKKLALSLIEERLNIFWGGNARIHPDMNHDYINTLYKAGCRHISFGIESASENVLRDMKKGFSINTATDVLRTSSENGIWVHTYWILGFRSETKEDLLETVHFIIRNHSYINSYAFHLYCDIFRLVPDLKEQKNLKFKNFMDYISHNGLDISLTGLYFKENLIFFKKIHKILENSPHCDFYFNTCRKKPVISGELRRLIDDEKSSRYKSWILLGMYLIKFYIEKIEFQENIKVFLNLESFSRAFDKYLDKYNVQNICLPKANENVGFRFYELLISK